MTFTMAKSVNALDQVVVTGTIAATEVRALPNAITVITAKQLEDRGITHIDQLFRGDVPGLFVQNLGTAPKSNMGLYVKKGGVKMYSRGASVLDSASPPIKTYVDGIELADPDYLNQIDPSSIERIEIITGPQASTVYGSGALGGVMQIFTKKGRLGQRRPEVTLTLRYGALENNYSSAIAPRHDDEFSISDAYGPYSYRVGGTYYYDGQWTPGMYTRRYGTSGGLVRSSGPLDITVTGAYSKTRLGAAGGIQQERLAAIQDGREQYNADLVIPTYGSVYDIFHSQIGTTISYRPFSWWSHSLTLGIDQSSNGSETNGARFVTPSDTLNVQYVYSNPQNKTLSYNTTVRQTLSWFSASLSFGGNLSRANTVNRTATGMDIDHLGTAGSGFMNETRTSRSSGGYYGTGLFGLANTLYLTLGVRAERNRAFGADRRTDVTPTWGLSAVRDVGAMTLKARFTYGRATRPPPLGAPDSVLACVQTPTSCAYYTQYFGSDVLVQLANSALKPESQAGPDWGIDVYFGSRGSLSITHYDQKVRDLLFLTEVNTVTSPLSQYNTIRQTQWQNLGDIGNNGWLGSASLNLGRVTLNGSYSWTRSRVLRLNPSYTGTQTEGSSMLGMAEHTAALTTQYSTAKTMVKVSPIIRGRSARTVSCCRASANRGMPRISMRQTCPSSRSSALSGRRCRCRSMRRGRLTGIWICFSTS
jgi:outer membrane receptor protein involved in Fe transport